MIMPRDPIVEVLDRLRRIETRFTSFMAQAGYDTGTKRCEFIAKGGHGGIIRIDVIKVPSPNVSLKEIVAVVPKDATGTEIEVWCGEQFLGSIIPPSKQS